MFRRSDGRTFTRDPTELADGADVYASVDGDLEPRVWGTRLGFVGVARSHRRRGIARALLGHVFAVLAARGVTEVTTEIDVENVASRRTIEPLGSRVVGQSVELLRRIR